MVDTPQNIQLRRFIRSITVAGLGAGSDDQTNPSPTVTRSFDGVLGLGISTEPGGPPVHLSYLTLAPLLAREFVRESRHRRPPQTERPVEKANSTSGDSSDADEKLRVRDLVRNERDDSPPGSDALGRDLTVTAGPGQRETAGPGPEDPPDKRADRSGRSDRWQQSPRGHGPGGVPDLAAADLVRTVVGRPATKEGHADTHRERTSSLPGPTPPGGAGPEREANGGPGESTASVATTVARTVAEEPETGEDDTSSSSLAPADSGHPMSSDDRGESGLTVTSGRASPAALADESDELGEAEYGDPGDANDARTDRQKDRESVDERTIIRSDGRVNERVLDRLYEELDRKMRLERRREGR